MKFFKLFLYIVLAFCFLFIGRHTFAETFIGNAYINDPVVWTLDESPYIIEGYITISNGGSLEVEPGVSIIVNDGKYIYSQRGRISLLGTETQPITVTTTSSGGALFSGDASQMYFDYVKVSDGSVRRLIEAWNGSEVYINNLEFKGQGRIGSWISVFTNSVLLANEVNISGWLGNGIEVFNNSSSTITNSTFERIGRAVYVYQRSNAEINGSVFKENKTGLETFDSLVFAEKNDFEENNIALHHDIGRATSSVEAMNNWWGNVSGPKTVSDLSSVAPTDQNVVVGSVNAIPWSTEPHRKTIEHCCSNILFLPGLMGSRLYLKDGLFENQLWEPNRNADVKKLFLDNEGQSSQSGIYTRDIINRTNIVGGIGFIEQTPYQDFAKAMDALVTAKTITAWQSAPYDWRFAPDTIINTGITYGTEIKQLTNQVISLASSSETNKVTLITHSNGGLVAKQLMIKLKEINKEYLVDKIIFVGMPEYGTPQAVTSLLFGHEQSIAGGMVLKSSVAKDLGKNMPTAYTLLPSESFFQNRMMKVGDKDVYSLSNLSDILKTYTHVNSNLLNTAQLLRQSLDSWIPPTSLKIFQIVGTGLPTVSGLQKIKKDTFIPSYTKTGDGIVQDMFNTEHKTFQRSGKVKAVDLSKEDSNKYKHATMMNEPTVLKYINQMLHSSDVVTNSDVDMVGQVHSEAFYYELAEISEPEKTIDDISLKNMNYISEDVYTSERSGSFDKSKEYNNNARYEAFDTGIFYLTNKALEGLEIIKKTNGLINIDLFKHTTESGNSIIQKVSYTNTPIFSGGSLSIDGEILSVDGGLTITPTSITTLNAKGDIISETISTSTKTIEEKIGEVRLKISTSTISDFIKTGYLRRLGVFAKNKDQVYLIGIIDRLKRGIANIDRYKGIPSLWGRYAKTRQEYVWLLYVFTSLDRGRPGNLQL